MDLSINVVSSEISSYNEIMLNVLAILFVIVPFLILFLLIDDTSFLFDTLGGSNLGQTLKLLVITLIGAPSLALILLLIKIYTKKGAYSKFNPFLWIGIIGGACGIGVFFYVAYYLFSIF